MSDHGDSVRVDRWLLATRVFKTRTLSQQACAGGKVLVNDVKVSAHRPIRVRDRIQIQGPRGLRDLIVLGLGERRLPAPEAQLLYDDKSPPPAPREETASMPRERGSGRPSKRDRRSMDRFRRG